MYNNYNYDTCYYSNNVKLSEDKHVDIRYKQRHIPVSTNLFENEWDQAELYFGDNYVTILQEKWLENKCLG